MATPVYITSLFIINLIFQVGTLIMLPLSEGFSKPIQSIATCVFMCLSLWCIAKMIVSGLNMGILFPMISASTPLAAIAVGVLLAGESASVVKIILLAASCALIGVASRF